jgi:hypothetical protein
MEKSMSGYLFAYALGCGSTAAAFWVWPKLTAAAAARVRKLKDAIRAKLS